MTLQFGGNDIHSIRSDGMNFATVTGVLIEGNHIHDFRGALNSADHRDMLQFHTSGTDSPSTNITIRDNHFDIGAGDYAQTIFMRNEEVDLGRAGQEMFYQNVIIEDNVIVNAHANGISVGETDGLIVRNNSVLHADGRIVDGADNSVEIPRISLAPTSTNVTIANNIAADINGTSPGWTVTNNAIVQDQDPAAAGYYGDVFITSSLSMVGTTHEFLAIPGGLLSELNAGASATHDAANVSDLTVRFHITGSEDSAALYHFDASDSLSSDGALPPGTVYTWTFADGTVLTGERVSYAFENGGIHDASLSVTLPDGETSQATIAVAVAGSNLVSYDTANGLVTYDDIDDPLDAISARAAPTGIVTTQQGVALSVEREHVVGIVGQDEFAIALSLQGNTPGDTGEIMRLQGSFIVEVNSRGELYLRTFTEDGGQTQLTTTGTQINDGAAHDIAINFVDGVLSISVDGAVRASTSMDAPLGGADSHNLVFGNPWNDDNFESTITAFDLTINASDFAEAASLLQTEGQAEETPNDVAPAEQDETAPSAPAVDPMEVFETLYDTTDLSIAEAQSAATGNVPLWSLHDLTASEQDAVENDPDVLLRECGIASEPEADTPKGSNGNTSREALDAFENMMLLGNSDTFFG